MGKPAFDISKLTEDLPLSPELHAELDRRLDRFDRDGSVGVACEDVLAEMTPGAS